jgi:hypothetical protein
LRFLTGLVHEVFFHMQLREEFFRPSSLLLETWHTQALNSFPSKKPKQDEEIKNSSQGSVLGEQRQCNSKATASRGHPSQELKSRAQLWDRPSGRSL